MNIRYHVELSEAERCELTALVGSNKHYAPQDQTRAQILLAADSGKTHDEDIAAAVAVGGSTVYRTKRRFVKGNLEAALNEEPRASIVRKLTSSEEALSTSPPPVRARPKVAPAGTMELLAGAMVKLDSTMTVSRGGKPSADAWPKTISSLSRRTCGASPRSTPSTSPAWRMCSTSMPSSLTRSGPWSASTKAPRQLIGEARQLIPGHAGRLRALRLQYRRNRSRQSRRRLRRCPSLSAAGSRSPIVAPLTTSPFACASSSIVDFPEGRSGSASSSITSPPTPLPLSTRIPGGRSAPRAPGGLSSTALRASWLSMVEIEIGVLKGQCLDRRIESCDRLVAEIDV